MNDWMPCSKLDRRSPATRKKGPPRYGRIFGRVFGLVLLGLICVVVLRKVARPIILCYGEARSVNELSLEYQQIQRENEELLQKKVYLASIEGAQIEARKLGWVMPGERSIVIENPSDIPAESASKKKHGPLGWLGL